MEKQLWNACYDGKVEEVTQLLQNSQLNINWQDHSVYDKDSKYPWSTTPLYVACYKGHIEVVKLLLKHQKVDVNRTDNDYFFLTPLLRGLSVEVSADGNTPLWIACYHGHIEIVKYLLENGRDRDINKANNKSETPLYAACDWGDKGRIDVVKVLLNDANVDVNKADRDGLTPFYNACRWGRIEILELLLNDKRVDINQAKNDGWTPFYHVCYNGRIDVVKYLLESGREIDINKKDKDGVTGLDIAREKGNRNTVKLIESFKKNPNETRESLRFHFELAGKSLSQKELGISIFIFNLIKKKNFHKKSR